MGCKKKSGFSFLGLFKLKRKRARREDDIYEREGVSVTRAYYKVWPSDEDRLNWVADPEIDAKATAFLNNIRQQFRRGADDEQD